MDFDPNPANVEHPLLTCMTSKYFGMDYMSAISHTGFIPDLVNHFKHDLADVSIF